MWWHKKYNDAVLIIEVLYKPAFPKFVAYAKGIIVFQRHCWGVKAKCLWMLFYNVDFSHPPFLNSDKVLRLKPVLNEHVKVIRELANSVQVPICFHTYRHTHMFHCSSVWLCCHLQLDFWTPENAEQVTVGMSVDIRVPAQYLDMVFTVLQQSGMQLE